MIKKIFILCCFLYCIALTAAPVTARQNTSPPNISPYMGNLQDIINRGKLIVAIPKINQPFLFAPDKNGNLQGYYIDLAKEIAQELGVKVEFNRSAASFNGVVDLIEQGKADVAICHLSKTIDRAKKVLFTNTNVTLYQTVLINRVWLAQYSLNEPDTEAADPIAILKKNRCTIGILEKSSYIEFAQDLFPLAILKEYTIENLFPAIINGKVDVVFFDDFDTREQLLEQPNMILKFRAIILTNHADLIAMAVPPGRWELLQWLNHYLELKNINANADTLLQYRIRK